MKILMIIPKYNLSNEINYNYAFPFGLAYLLAVLKKEEPEVDCLNLNHIAGGVSELINKELDNKKYDVICSGGNAMLYDELKIISETIKNHKTKPLTILGGPIITSEPKLMFENLKPDYAVFGEGEITILELLKAIKQKKSLSKIEGIVYKNKDNKTEITSPRKPIENIEQIPYPDFDAIGFEKILDNMHCNDSLPYQIFDYPRAYSLLASRGCPFNCSFCWHPLKYRARKVKDIMEELEFVVKKYKINLLAIQDDCFSLDKKRLYDFCKEIKKFKKSLSWDLKWSCQLLVNSVDEDMLKTMKDSGCHQISYGFESYSSKVLKSMRKPITPEQIDYALKTTWKQGIGITANFIFGDPVETKETAKETLEYWKKNCKGQFNLLFIQPYPGSEVYRHCLKKGIIKDKIDYIRNKMYTHASINMTENMTEEEFTELRKALLDLFSKYAKFVRPILMKQENKKQKTFSLKVKCPFCNKIETYKNCYVPNKYTYGFHLMCRNCHLRFYAVSLIQKLAYRHYSKIRTLRDYQLHLSKLIKKMKM